MKLKKNTLKIIGIDPGLTNTGVCVCLYDPDNDHLTVQSKFMICAHELAKREMRQDSKQYGNIVSLFLYEREFKNVFLTHLPNFVASEDAFYNPRTPNAYLSLKLCISSIQRVLYEDFKQVLYRIAPMEAKKAVRKGNADKAAVQEAIQHLPDLILRDTKQNPISKITEHEADSIAIAYAFKKMYLPDLLMQTKR